MTMDAYALCNRSVPSTKEWQVAIDELKFELRLRDPDRDLATAYGHLPALWRGREAGFECGVIPVPELLEAYPQLAPHGPWSCAYAFHFATLPGCVGAWFAVAACVRLVGGIAYDPQDDLILTPGEAARYALEGERQFLAMESD